MQLKFDSIYRPTSLPPHGISTGDSKAPNPNAFAWETFLCNQELNGGRRLSWPTT
ncbi:hypothetical protein Pta6605_07770 [Pseudomonas amygdali pv. tabaci]|nr:hypothetical protein Pta6605_07770 [Pseudomonas amygdali pv. tabaci]